MALSSIPVPPDPKRDAKARELVMTAHLWPIVTLKQPYGAFKTGDSFLVTPNGYRVSTVVCECADYQRFGNICKHIRCAILLDEQRTTKPSPKTVEELWPSCDEQGCTDEREPRSRFCWRHCLVDAF